MSDAVRAAMIGRRGIWLFAVGGSRVTVDVGTELYVSIQKFASIGLDDTRFVKYDLKVSCFPAMMLIGGRIPRGCQRVHHSHRILNDHAWNDLLAMIFPPDGSPRTITQTDLRKSFLSPGRDALRSPSADAQHTRFLPPKLGPVAH
jgi:hypothetical protein